MRARKLAENHDDSATAHAHEASAIAHAIVDTVREPLIVLDQDLRAIAASRSFCLAFAISPDEIQGKLVYELGDGEWDHPKVRLLLGKIIPEQGAMKDCEIEYDSPEIGHRTMLLNARKIIHEAGNRAHILLGIEDITAQRVAEQEEERLLRQKDVLLKEHQHRVSNSLQIIASILMLKAQSVESEETRRYLHDAHNRVISVAAIQQHLDASDASGFSELEPYLAKLCEALSQSMIGDSRPITLKFCGEGGLATCRTAESIGLIVTELVINALKHAFADDTTDGQITVAYDVSGTDWKLTIADNGLGRPAGVLARPKAGLGTSIIKALAKQLDARVTSWSGRHGTTVSITHTGFGNR